MAQKIGTQVKFIVLAGAAALVSVNAFAVDIHLAGDSTLETRAPECKIQSWGEKLALRLKPGHRVVNRALSGRSTVTFRKTWEDKLIGNVKEGDFVIIQFGHNDQWHTEKKYEQPGVPDRFCTPEQFGENVRRMVCEVKERKATPVVLSTTPVGFDAKSGAKPSVSAHKKPYMDQLPKVAADEQVAFVDMLAIGNATVGALGVDRARQLYVMAFGGEDNVHPTELGARLFCELFVSEVKARKLPIADLIK